MQFHLKSEFDKQTAQYRLTCSSLDKSTANAGKILFPACLANWLTALVLKGTENELIFHLRLLQSIACADQQLMALVVPAGFHGRGLLPTSLFRGE